MAGPMPMHSALARRTVLGAALSCPLWPALAQPGAADPPALLKALQAGGLVVYFRHGATDRGGVDRADWPRSRQRLLSPEGEAQARTVGEVFRRHRLGVAEVLASPMARCHDFARIAFGRVRDDALLLGLLTQDAGRQPRIEHSLALLRQAVAAGHHRILVGHSSNIQSSTGIFPPEGGAVLARPDGGAGQGFTVLGELRPHDWAALATA